MSIDERHLNYVNFNQDRSQICMTTRDRYCRISVDPFNIIYEKQTINGDDASIFEVLFKSNLAAVVLAGSSASTSQRLLRIINLRKNQEIASMMYPTMILRVHINRSVLVVVLETIIYVYDIKTINLLHQIVDIPTNPQGISTLASCHVIGNPEGIGTNSYLAYPSSNTIGEVYIYDTVGLRFITAIEAHRSPLSCISFNCTGKLLATASQKGTVIRVFNCSTGQKLYEFRRGTMTNATINSMTFNLDSVFLSTTSDKSTIHIFKLQKEEKQEEVSKSLTSYIISSASSLITNYFPALVTEPFTQLRSFAYVVSPSEGNAIVGTLTGPENNCVLYLVTSNGYFVKYSVDLEKGGECQEKGRHYIFSNCSNIKKEI